MYLLKKLLVQLFMPVPLSLALCLTGLALLWLTRKQKTGKILVTIGTILMIVSSYGFVPGLLIRKLEKPFSPFSLPAQSSTTSQSETPVKWIVVLGSGNIADPRLPGKASLTPSSLFRVVEGVRLYRGLPNTKLVFCGGPTSNPIPEAETMAQTALDLGVPKQDVVVESHSKDTADQAQTVRQLVNDEPFILVSSASHLERALWLFKQAGLSPTPAPVDFRGNGQGTGAEPYAPGAGHIRTAELAIHEYLGLIWYRLRGQ